LRTFADRETVVTVLRFGEIIEAVEVAVGRIKVEAGGRLTVNGTRNTNRDDKAETLSGGAHVR
jgi:hypothetical protein